MFNKEIKETKLTTSEASIAILLTFQFLVTIVVILTVDNVFLFIPMMFLGIFSSLTVVLYILKIKKYLHNKELENKDTKIKIVRLKGIRREVTGELLDLIDVDYTLPLMELKLDIEYAVIEVVMRNKERSKLIENKVQVYDGSSHLDIIDVGVGSLKWLTVRDIECSKY